MNALLHRQHTYELLMIPMNWREYQIDEESNWRLKSIFSTNTGCRAMAGMCPWYWNSAHNQRKKKRKKREWHTTVQLSDPLPVDRSPPSARQTQPWAWIQKHGWPRGTCSVGQLNVPVQHGRESDQPNHTLQVSSAERTFCGLIQCRVSELHGCLGQPALLGLLNLIY